MYRISVLIITLLAAASAAASTNVVLVTLDTVRADHLSLYGYAEKTSPNLDAAAARARVFTQAYSIVPLTFPAHTTILSGHTPFEDQVFLNGQIYTPSPDFLPSMLKKRKYATAAFLSAAILDRNFGLGKDFDVYADMMDIAKKAGTEVVERSAADTTALALGWLKKAPKPFFLWVHYFDPHAPYTPPKAFADKFKHPYDGEIASVDASLDRLLKALPKDTFIVIVGDHGEMLGEHGEDEHGVLLYQGAVHIPLIVMGPGVVPGREDKPACLLDVYPTLLAAVKEPLPAGIQGQNLLTLSDPDRPVIASSLYGREVLGFLPSVAALKSGLKLIGYGDRDYRLFDIAKDPGEAENLFLTQRPKVREMKRITDTVKFPETLAIAIQEEDKKKLTALGYSSPKKVERLVHPEEGLKYEKMFKQAKALIDQNKMDDASVLLEGLLSRDPAHTEARMALGKLYMKMGKQGDAREVFTGLANRNAANPEAHIQLAETMAAQGEPEKAIQEYKVALTLDPRQSDAYAKLARIYYARKDVKGLEDLKASAKQYSIENAELFGYLGFTALNEKKVEEARDLFTYARDLDPSLPLPLKGLATLNYMQGKSAESLELWKAELKLTPKDPEANYMAGSLILEAGGGKDEALAYFRAALEKCPGPRFCDMVKQAIAKAEGK